MATATSKTAASESASTAAPVVNVAPSGSRGNYVPFYPTRGQTIAEFRQKLYPNGAIADIVFYKITKEEMDSIWEQPIDVENALLQGRSPLKPGDALLEDMTFLIAVTRTPSSATGKCPHSIVFPSVARSSLTWSRCFVCPLLWLLVQGARQVQQLLQ